jgi:hypothetical protein
MHLYYFGKVSSETSQKLLTEIENISDHIVQIFQTVTSLTKRLRQIEATPEFFIFAPSTNNELSELIAQKGLFKDHSIILILPDSSNTTIHNGHLLLPRFLTFADSNLSEVVDVLEKMRSSNFLNPSIIIN